MDIRQLKYFVSTVRHGGVGAAAEEHFVTQPAVSAQLKRLEESVGEKLFVREGRRLVPTQAGELLLSRAEAVIAGMEELERAMRGLKRLETGRLRLGNIDAASVYVLPEIYRTFHERYPQVRLEIVVGDTRTLLDLLRRGRVELATATLPVDDDGVTARTIYREELVVVAAPGHPLASRKRIRPGDLTEHGVISYPSSSSTRRLIDGAFAEHGATVRSTMEISSPEAMKRLVQAGLGVSVLPRPVVAGEVDSGALVQLPVSRVRIEREIGMVYRDEAALSPAARAFLDMVAGRFPAFGGDGGRETV